MKEYSDSENRNRRLVLNFIMDNPGATFIRISKVLDLNEGTLRYHIGFLKKGGRIKSCLKNGRRCYFSSLFVGMSNGFESDQDSLKSYQRRILDLIELNPNITKSDLLNRTVVNKRKLTYFLDQSLRRGMIREVQNGDDIGYQIVSREMIIGEMLLLLVKDLAAGKIDQETFLRLKNEIESCKK